MNNFNFNISYMAFESDKQNNGRKENEGFTNLSFIKQETIIAIPDDKIIDMANEHLRVKKIYEHLADYCIQFFFLN